MDWGEILKPLIGAALGSGFAFAGLRLWFDYAKDHKQRDEKAKFLAVQIVYHLEEFVTICADALVLDEVAEDSGQQSGNHLTAVPDFAELPKGDSYQLLPLPLVERIYAFPQQVKSAQGSVHFAWDVADPSDAMDEAEKQTFFIAERALQLALDVRTTYQMGRQAVGTPGWDIGDYIRAGARRHRGEGLRG